MSFSLKTYVDSRPSKARRKNSVHRTWRLLAALAIALCANDAATQA